jgi:hypothetical protein
MDDRPMTTAGLQAKVQLRKAWFATHPDQPVPEARAAVEELFSAIEADLKKDAEKGWYEARIRGEMLDDVWPGWRKGKPRPVLLDDEWLVTILQSDADNTNRDQMWRYGVKHALTLVRRTLAATPAPLDVQPGDAATILGIVLSTSVMSDKHPEVCIEAARPMISHIEALGWTLRALATPAPLDVPHDAPVDDEPCARCGVWRRFHEASDGPEYSRDHSWVAVTPAPLDGHQTPGEYHDYRVACVKCGEPGFLHVSWRPEKAEEASE